MSCKQSWRKATPLTIVLMLLVLPRLWKPQKATLEHDSRSSLLQTQSKQDYEWSLVELYWQESDQSTIYFFKNSLYYLSHNHERIFKLIRACCMKYIVHVHIWDDVTVMQLGEGGGESVSMCVCGGGGGVVSLFNLDVSASLYCINILSLDEHIVWSTSSLSGWCNS